MKMYNNGPRKAMMYGGAAKRKPMMYGGTAMKKKPRKKAQAGGMMTSTQGQQNQQRRNQKQPMGMPMMAGGGSLKMVEVDGKMVPEYAADGKGAKDLRKNMNEGGAVETYRQMMQDEAKDTKSIRERVEKILDSLSDKDKKDLMDMIRKNYR